MQSGPSRPGVVRPAQVAPVGGYTHAGALTSEQVINGEANQYAWLDPKVLEVVGVVQQSLVNADRAEEIEKARTDPQLRAQMTQEIDRLALQYLVKERAIRGEEGKVLIATVVNEILGLGPLEPLWDDPSITEVIVNGPDKIYVEQEGRLRRAKGCRFRSQDHLLEVCQRILSPLNRKVDVRDPLADGRLPDGSRVNVVHQALAPEGPLLTIRRFPEKTRSLIDLVDIGSLDEEMATLLATLVANRASILVVGSTGSGKSLDVDTPIPTPGGFVRMGELKVGDLVFDEHGKPTEVVGAYDVQYDRPCYEVVFSDGSTVVADEEHLWLTETRVARTARGRQRNTFSVAKRAPVINEHEVAVLSNVLAGLPSDAVVATSALSAELGWDERRHGRWYPVAKECSVTGKLPRTGERLFLARDLIPKALTRWARPWHDQRHQSETAQVRTTAEIRDSLMAGEYANHSVPLVSGPVAYPERDLPLHPRLLGLWLGDGASACARFSTADEALLEDFARADYTVRHIDRFDYSISGGLQAVLRSLGVLKNKHIPDEYLYASEAQRRALLSGLLDTDGGVAAHGGVEFYSSNERLARQVFTLVASLGYRPTLREKESRLYGVSHGSTWTVAFLGSGEEFGLERKTRTQRERRSQKTQGDRHVQRYITDVRPVPSRPVRCIRVANDSHLFLAGEAYIPTHNTTLLNSLSVAIPRNERLVTIEDSLELRLHPDAHVAALEARPADSSGRNAVTIRNLVKNALRMRPDRIIVGEIRDAAALDMLQACNTGHEGSMSTVHANGPNEAVSRLAVMVAQGGEIPADKVDWLVGSALDIIVVASRYEDGSRRVSGIYEVPDINELEDGTPLRVVPLWEWEQTGVDEDGRLVGEYVKRNDMSASLRKAKSLDLVEPVTWEALLELCGAPAADTAKEDNAAVEVN